MSSRRKQPRAPVPSDQGRALGVEGDRFVAQTGVPSGMSRLLDGAGAGGVHGGRSLTAPPWAWPLPGECRGWTVDWLDCVTAGLQQGGRCARRSKNLLDERTVRAACRRWRRPRGHPQLGDSKFRGPRPGPQGAARRSALSVLGAQNLRSPPWTTGRGFVAPAGKGGAAGRTSGLSL